MSDWSAWQKLWLRRTFVVDRRLQFGIVLRITGYAVFTLAVLSIGLLLPAASDIRKPDVDELEILETANVFLYMHSHYWPAAMLCLFVIVIGAVHLSHRIAGPLVQVKRALNALAQGVRPEAVQTRKRDFLKTEVALLNQVVDSLAERVAVVERADRELIGALSCLPPANALDAAAMDEALARVRENADRLHESIHQLPRTANAQGASVALPEASAPNPVPATPV